MRMRQRCFQFHFTMLCGDSTQSHVGAADSGSAGGICICLRPRMNEGLRICDYERGFPRFYFTCGSWSSRGLAECLPMDAECRVTHVTDLRFEKCIGHTRQRGLLSWSTFLLFFFSFSSVTETSPFFLSTFHIFLDPHKHAHILCSCRE